MAHARTLVAVRDSKAPILAALTFPTAVSAGFLEALKEPGPAETGMMSLSRRLCRTRSRGTRPCRSGAARTAVPPGGSPAALSPWSPLCPYGRPSAPYPCSCRRCSRPERSPAARCRSSPRTARGPAAG
ncbi:DUF397 domain-containing protein [Streptomyces sp. NPDC014676]|uniref:DUF397 domain-containing protein n=1 Tax=Streptomyces sp. NPDC014676 TaxID=3364879 RepID=UPI0036FDEE04